jgi:hypothetical protein
MGQLQHFSGDQIVLDNQEAWQILVFFFGGNASLSPASLTDNDRSFAQALLIEAIDASEDMSWIEAIFRSAMKPNASVKSIIKSLIKKAVKDWFKHANKDKLDNPTIYQSVKNQLTVNWRSAWQIRVETDGEMTAY